MKREPKHVKDIKGGVEIWNRPNHKTAIDATGQPYNAYYVVTKQTYITACLWLDHRNKTVGGKKGFIELPAKPNWLVLTRSFRRDQDKLMKLVNP